MDVGVGGGGGGGGGETKYLKRFKMFRRGNICGAPGPDIWSFRAGLGVLDPTKRV